MTHALSTTQTHRTAFFLAAAACLGSAPALAGDLSVTVLDGGLDRPMPISGVTAEVTTGSGTDTTDGQGAATLSGLTGTRTVRISGEADSGFGTVLIQADVPTSGTQELLVLLPRVATNLATDVAISGGVVAGGTANIESTILPNARLRLEGSTAVGGVSDGTLEASIFSVDNALTPTAFPGELQPRRMWTIQPAGLTFGTSAINGGTLRLPNEEGLAAGTTQDLWTYDAEQGTWVKLGTMTVESGGDYLESEPGIITHSGYFALDTKSPLVNAEFSLSLTGPSGSALSGATVTLHGHELEETSAGTYSTTAWVTTGTPVRAFVTTTLGSTLRLSAMTRPTLAVPFNTALNQGEALSMKLTAVSAQSVSMGFTNTSLSGSGYEATHAYGPASAAPVTTITYENDPMDPEDDEEYQFASGPLEDAFPNAKPHKPLVQFSHVPSSAAAITSRYVAFSLKVSDADLTSRGKLVSVEYSLDGGSTFPYTATIIEGDLPPYRAPECGGNEFMFLWDRFASFPASTTGNREVSLRVTFEDEPGGRQVTVVLPDADRFWVYYPTPLNVVRSDPQKGATGVYKDSAFLVEFDLPLDPSTVTSGKFEVYNNIGATPFLLVTTATLVGDRKVRLKPSGGGNWSTAALDYRILVDATVASTSGATIGTDEHIEFNIVNEEGLSDPDDDGLLTVEETAYGLDEAGGSSATDWDGDGLSDYHEIYVSFTDPKNSNTDGDATPDGSDTDPLDGISSPAPVASGGFTVLATAPSDGATVTVSASGQPKILITFSNPVDDTSLALGTNLYLEDSGNNPITLTHVSTPTEYTLELEPTGTLTAGSYTLTLTSGTSSVQDTSGGDIGSTFTTSFTVAAPGTLAKFEAKNYFAALGQVQWESYALTTPTAGGRNGQALVVPSTGQLLVTETDVSTPTRGLLPVSITRIHRSSTADMSSNGGGGVFGEGWHLSLDQRMTVSSVNAYGPNFQYLSADGRVYDYNRNESAFVYTSPTGHFDTLHEVTFEDSTHLKLRKSNGTSYYFQFRSNSNNHVVAPSSATAGDTAYLVAVEDRNQNVIVISRFAATSTADDQPANAISSIADPSSRTTTFAYYDSSGDSTGGDGVGLLKSITQFNELAPQDRRTWSYEYNSNDVLETVAMPEEVVGTGTTESFRSRTYSYNGTTRLSSVLDPRGDTTLRVFYDPDDRVCQVDYACDDICGTSFYTYEVDTSTDTNIATAVDRNGNVSMVEHEAAPSGDPMIGLASVLPRGIHGSEPTTYQVGFDHNSRNLIQKVANENTKEAIAYEYCECGCPKKIIQLEDYLNPSINDLITCIQYSEAFAQPVLIIPPQAIDPSDITPGDPCNLEEDPYEVADFDPDYATYIAYDEVTFADNIFYAGVFSSEDVMLGYNRQGASDYYDSFNTIGSGLFSVPDDDGDGFPDRGGNPIAVRGPKPTIRDQGCLTSGSYTTSQQNPKLAFSYNEHGQRYLVRQPDGQLSRSEFVPGNYGSSNQGAGFADTIVVSTNHTDVDLDPETGDVDSSPSQSTGHVVTTTLDYDRFGNVKTKVDPRGHEWRYLYNSLDMVTKITAPEFSPAKAYEVFLYYDANNNLVERRVKNYSPTDLDGDGLQDDIDLVAGAEDLVTTMVYNSANLVSEVSVDATGSTPGTLTTRYEYDRRLNRVLVQHPAGNVDVWRYDERNLVYEQVLGYSDPTRSQTIAYDYDAKRRLTYVYDDDGSNLSTAAVSYEYDGFDRVTKQTDESGNYVEFTYDRRSLIQSKKVYNSTASLLEHTVFNYDEANRMIQVSRELANPQDSLTTLAHTRVIPYVNRSADTLLSGEFVYSLIKYDEEGKIKHVCDDNAHHTDYDYDNADRLETITDHLGSTVSYAYDQASNVIRITEVERHTNGVDSDETYYRDQFFDELNRLVATVSHTGQTMRYMYDSRNNLVQVSDAMGQENTGQYLGDLPYQDGRNLLAPTTRVTTVPINGRGNTVRYEYDGASRLLATHEDLRAGGVGMGAVLNSITTRQAWDANSRVEMRIDPKGNATGYRYDHQDRLIREMLADGRQTRYHYNNNGTLAMKVDPRGVVEEYTYDALERLTDVAVSNLPTGVGQTTFKHWQYDGLSRTTRAEDNDTICTYSYDSLSRVKQEGQSVGFSTVRNSKNDTLTSAVTGYVTRSYDGVGNLFRLYYPADHTGSTPGSNYVKREYDGVDRLSAVKRVAGGTTTIAEFEHIGMGGRRSERNYLPSSTNMTCTATFDDERRFLTLEAKQGLNTITSFAYGWDRADNRRYESDLVAGTGDFYTYDSAYRLTNVERGVSSATLAALGNNKTSVTAPQGDWTKALSYHLDNSGNRTETWEGNSITPYTLDIGAPTYNSPLNQYTMLGDKIRSHDDSGNVTSDDSGATQRFFDCDNRLVQSDGATQDAEYRYDVQGRRVAKLLTGSVTASILYFYDGWQCVEETATSGATTKTYVYGEGIDEVLRATIPEPTSVDIDGDMTTGEAAVDVYYHHNSIGSVMAVTNASGTVVESYSYKPYGAVTIKDHNGSEISATRIEQPWMFTGRRLDFEEGGSLYYYRLRYYDPEAGRFISRDPLGMWGDAGQRGNPQNYCGNNPVNRIDPYGDWSPPNSEMHVEGGDISPREQADLYNSYASGSEADQARYDYWRTLAGAAYDRWTRGVKGDPNARADFVTATCPVVNDIRDAAELWYGFDLFTGEPLDYWDYALTAGGLVLGSGSYYRSIRRKLFGPKRVRGDGDWFDPFDSSGDWMHDYEPPIKSRRPRNAGDVAKNDAVGSDIDAGSHGNGPQNSTGGRTIPNSELEPPTKRGNAPTGGDGKPVELHHRDQTHSGPLDEMSRREHRGPVNYGDNHHNTGQSPSQIDRSQFDRERREYWNQQWDSGRWAE